METSDLIAIGEIVKARGVNGELKVIPLTDNPKRFGEIRRVFFKGPAGVQELSIRGYRVLNGTVLVKFEGINDLTAAELLGRGLMMIPKEERPNLPAGRFYQDDILGLKVYTIMGEFLGTVEQIFSTGANDVYSVRHQSRQVLVPALKSVVKQIDLVKGKMVVELPEGLVEEPQ